MIHHVITPTSIVEIRETEGITQVFVYKREGDSALNPLAYILGFNTLVFDTNDLMSCGKVSNEV